MQERVRHRFGTGCRCSARRVIATTAAPPPAGTATARSSSPCTPRSTFTGRASTTASTAPRIRVFVVALFITLAATLRRLLSLRLVASFSYGCTLFSLRFWWFSFWWRSRFAVGARAVLFGVINATVGLLRFARFRLFSSRSLDGLGGNGYGNIRPRVILFRASSNRHRKRNAGTSTARTVAFTYWRSFVSLEPRFFSKMSNRSRTFSW